MLNARQQRFVDEYLVDLNATKAAERAGYSKKTARQIGQQNLSKLDIAEAIAKGQARRADRTEITQDRVLNELAALGFSDMGDYITIHDNGSVTHNFAGLPADRTKAIREITQEVVLEGPDEKPDLVRKTKFKLHDKRAALVDIGRHLGMFKNTLDLGDGLEAFVGFQIVAPAAKTPAGTAKPGGGAARKPGKAKQKTGRPKTNPGGLKIKGPKRRKKT